MIKKILRWIPAIIVMLIIFSFSQQHGDESKQLSIMVADSLLGALKEKIFGENYIVYVRKAAHFGMYFLLGICVLWAMLGYKIKRIAVFASSFGICALYAIFDEIHQMFVPGRGPMFFDVCIDCAGALLGCLLIFGIYEKYNSAKENGGAVKK